MKTLNNYIQEKYLIDIDTTNEKHFDIDHDVIRKKPTKNQENYIEIKSNNLNIYPPIENVWIDINLLEDKYFIIDNFYDLSIKILKKIDFRANSASFWAWDIIHKEYRLFAVCGRLKIHSYWRPGSINCGENLLKFKK